MTARSILRRERWPLSRDVGFGSFATLRAGVTSLPVDKRECGILLATRNILDDSWINFPGAPIELARKQSERFSTVRAVNESRLPRLSRRSDDQEVFHPGVVS